jgi:hypothetical protein
VHKRYLRVDLEYDMDANPLRLHSYVVLESLGRILREDMPYVRVVFTRDAPTREALDEGRGRQ